MFFPGERFFIPDFEVEEQHKEAYPEQWDRYQRGQSQIEGTPITSLPFMEHAAANILIQNKVLTAEQLAAVSDNAIAQIGPGVRKMRDMAIAYLDTSRGGAENARLKSEIEELREQVAALTETKCGRKPKVEAEAA